MKSNAAGQLFGYSLQFPRALLRLLQAKPGSKIGIEVCGDVSVFFPERNKLTEEDKSSLNNNPLADASENLWKTFYNWISAIKNKELNPDTDHFVLYTNHVVSNNSIVMKLSTAKTLTEIDAVVKFAENQLKNVSNAAVIEYRNFVLVENLVILKNIIPQFELVADNKADAVYNEIRGEIKGKYIPENQIEYLLNALTGWLQKLINQKIASREDAIISFEEFDKQFQVLFTRIRTKQELIDYANSKVPAKTELSQKVKERPLYVRQLEIIKSGQDEILEAVTDFFRADSNRLDWIEKGIIDEKAMTDFENHLCSFHANYQKKLMLTESSRPEEDRGRLLLIECQQRQEKIANMNPPDRTVQGSYHVLADEPRLGWHPRWQDMLTD